ncbi:unnamed protein product [Schistosoma turkestanicum]|nr:unnamed protein product [Schistosoma turkestanicum]
MEDFNVTQTFENVKNYLNIPLASEKFSNISNHSIVRYLQTTDWTIRRNLLADTVDGQPVQKNTDTGFNVQLPKHLKDTNLAHLALLKQNEYSQIIPKIENEAMEFDKQTVLIEQQWTNLCHVTECLQQQLNIKQNELKRLEDILQIKEEIF